MKEGLIKVLESAKRITKATLAVIGAGLFVTTCYGYCTYEGPKARMPTKQAVEADAACVSTFSAKEGGVYNGEKFIYDYNHDGQADTIGLRQHCYWVAPDLPEDMKKRCWNYDNTPPRVMTPEIREAAARAIKADHDLAYRLAEEEFKQIRDKEINKVKSK